MALTCNVCLETLVDVRSVQCTKCKFVTCVVCAEQYMALQPRLGLPCLGTCKMTKLFHVALLHRFLGSAFVIGPYVKSVRLGLRDHHLQNMSLYQTYARLQETVEHESAKLTTARALSPGELRALEQYVAQLQALLRQERLLLREPMNHATSLRNDAVQRCPNAPCAGWVTAPAFACGMCDGRLCPACRQPLGLSHVCLAENVRSVETLTRETKPCPSCRAPIFKASGCSQMFCTACASVFDWNTGLPQPSGATVHNPHAVAHSRDEATRRQRNTQTRTLCACDPDYHASLDEKKLADMSSTDLLRLVITRVRYLCVLRNVDYVDAKGDHPFPVAFLSRAVLLFERCHHASQYAWHNVAMTLPTTRPANRTYADINALYLRGRITAEQHADMLLDQRMNVELAVAVDRGYQELHTLWLRLLRRLTFFCLSSDACLTPQGQTWMLHTYRSSCEDMRGLVNKLFHELKTSFVRDMTPYLPHVPAGALLPAMIFPQLEGVLPTGRELFRAREAASPPPAKRVCKHADTAVAQ